MSVNNLVTGNAILSSSGRRSAKQTLPRWSNAGSPARNGPICKAGLGEQTWFCDPQSPCQRGTVENTNRRARRWLSREVDPLAISDHELRRVCDHLNTTPRKCLGFKTPAEIFRQEVMARIRYFFVDVKVPRLKSWTRRLSAAVGLNPSIGYSCPTPIANSRSGAIANVVARASLMASARSWLS